MARLLIVSRSLALGMRLADLHEVEERAADELDQGLPKVEGYDVLVLDVGDPVLAVNTVNSLREDEQAIPVMLVSGYQPEWEQVEAQQVEGVHVVSLPITRQALLRGVAILLDEDPDLITINPTGAMPVLQMGNADTSPDATVVATQPVPTRKPQPSAPPPAQSPAKPAAKPAPAGPKPAPADPRPAAGGPKPAAAGPRPAVAEPKPAPAGPKPAAAEPKPAAGGPKPAVADPKPSAAEPKPAPGGPKPAPVESKPATKVEPEPRPVTKAESQAAPKSESKPDSKPEPKAGSKPVSKPGPTPEPKAAEPDKAGPADVAAAKAVQQAAAQGPRKPPGTSGTLGQQFAARRAQGQGMGQGGQQGTQQGGQQGPQHPPAHTPQHDRNRRPGPRPAPDQIEVTPSPVAGLSYSSPVARPFSEQPPIGRFPLDRAPLREPGQRDQGPPNPQPSAPPQSPSSPLGGRQSRWRNSNPLPDTGSIPMDSSNIAANRRMARLGDRPRKFQRRTNPEDSSPRTPGRGLVTDPLGPRTDPYGLPTISALERRLDAEAAAMVNPRTTADGESVIRTADLIRTLQERSGELYGVSDTAQMLADDVIDRASAEAVAVLVPDGSLWRVSGGVGLRPLERRQELTESHWLVTEVGAAGRAVLVDDTDIVRQQLAGAPLGAWRHLMAVPVPDVRVIVVLARSEQGGPFTARDLTAVHTPIRESAVLLAQAIETRQLARALAPLREPEPEAGR